MSTNTEKQWRVQVRKSRTHKWVNKGLFETRDAARDMAFCLREPQRYWGLPLTVCVAYGFGNTRVVRYLKAVK